MATVTKRKKGGGYNEPYGNTMGYNGQGGTYNSSGMGKEIFPMSAGKESYANRAIKTKGTPKSSGMRTYGDQEMHKGPGYK